MLFSFVKLKNQVFDLKLKVETAVCVHNIICTEVCDFVKLLNDLVILQLR